MQLENSFTVPAAPDVAWAVLLDVERVAPCMPGATLTEHDGDTFGGTVKVKVGPIAMTYKGTAAFADKDDATHTVHIDAKGRETRGSGTANAKISCRLSPEGDGTRVDVTTDLAITGRPAQFGRGVMAEVAGKVITQFATALAEEIGSGSPSNGSVAPESAAAPSVPGQADVTTAPDGAPSSSSPSSQAPSGGSDERPAAPAPAVPVARERRSSEAIDLLDVAGAPVAKRLLPVAAAVLVALAFFAIIRRRRS